MINKKYKMVFLIPFVMILCILNIIDVNAKTNISGGNKSLGDSSCKRGTKYCFNNTIGLRMTLVKYEDNKIKRCKYDSKNKTLCGNTGDNLKSVDYWANGDEIYFYDTNFCFAYKNKLTKYERINSFNKGFGVCNKNYEKNVLELTVDGGFKYTGKNYFEAKNLKESIKSFNDDIENSGNHKYSINIINKFLQNSTGNSKLNIQNLTMGGSSSNKIYVQFEQLLYVSNYDNQTKRSGIATMGTVAESSYILMNHNNGFVRNCITHNSNLGGSVINTCSSGQESLYAYGGWIGFYGSKSGGGNLGKDVPSGIPGLTNGDLDRKQLLNVFVRDDTANVANVWVNLSDCNSIARGIVNNYFSSGSLKSGKTEQTYLKALYDNKDTKKCVTKNGSTYKLKDDCNALDPLSLKTFKGVGVTDACSHVDCNNQLNKGVLKNYTKSSDIESLSNKLYDYWDSRKKKYMLLKKEMYDLLNDGKPECGVKTFTCEPVVGKISNCDANVTFTDSNSNDCWAKGIAYNNIMNKEDYKAYESSKDATLSSSFGSKCDVYCIESVTFNLPKDSSPNAYGTKAGRIFKWGNNTDTSDSLFGSMTITRTCQPISDSGGTCTSKTISPAYWVKNKIDTIISLTYKEPVSGREIGSSDLKTTFQKYSITVNGSTTSNLTDDSQKIKTNKKFKVTSTYRFDYSDSLHWYADKSIDNRYATKDSIDDISNAKYIEIGYGLPTDFTSPTVTYSLWKDETTGYNWENTTKSTKGYMYATIKNIGTKNNDNTHHFDKLIKTYSSNIGFDSNGTLKYSCDFNITNELFGTECVGSDNDPDYCNPDEPPKGLDVVFRTIDLIDVNASDMVEQLNRAFPGRSGVSRKIGKNWAEWLNGNPNDPTDTTNIYDILSDDIYDKKPLYTIKLDVSTIKKIRQYNYDARKTQDPYTYMGDTDGVSTNGYLGYKCVKGTGKFAYCASEFLTQLKSDSKIKFEGECAINTNGSTLKRAQNFSRKICG